MQVLEARFFGLGLPDLAATYHFRRFIACQGKDGVRRDMHLLTSSLQSTGYQRNIQKDVEKSGTLEICQDDRNS